MMFNYNSLVVLMVLVNDFVINNTLDTKKLTETIHKNHNVCLSLSSVDPIVLVDPTV